MFKTRNELQNELTEVESSLASVLKRFETLETEIVNAKSEEDLDNHEKELAELKEQKEALEKEKNEIEEKIKEIEAKNKTENKEGEDRNMNKELRKSVDKFIRTRGQVREGLKTDDVGVVIPSAVVYKPEKEVKTTVNLSKFVNRQKVNASAGTYPILKKATAALKTVEELDANPELAKPKFISVKWEVKTYRGHIPISQEAIDDSDADLVKIVEDNAYEQKINTTNAKIVEALKTLETRTISDTDGLKDIVNVEIDPAYNKMVVASQTFFNELDKLKDKNGRYLLQDNIQASSGKGILGMPIEVVSDTLFGESGTSQAFIGDLYWAVLMADRADLSAKWLEHTIYGQYLAIYTRFDTVVADKNAGFLVTFENAPEA